MRAPKVARMPHKCIPPAVAALLQWRLQQKDDPLHNEIIADMVATCVLTRGCMPGSSAAACSAGSVALISTSSAAVTAAAAAEAMATECLRTERSAAMTALLPSMPICGVAKPVRMREQQGARGRTDLPTLGPLGPGRRLCLKMPRCIFWQAVVSLGLITSFIRLCIWLSGFL